MRTHCGTIVYQAPELLGLLPREIAGTPQSYTKNVDIWAFGAVVHEVLTSEIPFLEPAAIADSFMDSTVSAVSTVSVDMDVLYNYCRGQPFPIKPLQHHGIGLDGINFVKSLMAANPMDRVSATDALENPWLGGNPSCDATFDPPPQRRPADSSRIIPLTQPAAKSTPPELPPRNNSDALLARLPVPPLSRSVHQSPAGEGQSRSQTGSPVICQPQPRPPMALPYSVPGVVRLGTRVVVPPGTRAVRPGTRAPVRLGVRAPAKPVILIRSVPRVIYRSLRLMTGSRLHGFTLPMQRVS